MLARTGAPDYAPGRVNFTADAPGEKFVGDITYIHTWQGFIYLATVIDCHSKKVVCWSIADHMRTELVADALKNVAATTVIYPGAMANSIVVEPVNVFIQFGLEFTHAGEALLP